MSGSNALNTRHEAYKGDTNHDTMEDDTRFQQQNLMILLGGEGSIEVVAVRIVVCGMIGVGGPFPLYRSRFSIIGDGRRLQSMTAELFVSDTGADKVEDEGDHCSRHGDGRCSRLVRKFTDTFVLEHNKAVKEEVLLVSDVLLGLGSTHDECSGYDDTGPEMPGDEKDVAPPSGFAAKVGSRIETVHVDLLTFSKPAGD